MSILNEELRLAQLRTKEYVEGLEGGIQAATRYILEASDVVKVDDPNFYYEISKREPREVKLRLMQMLDAGDKDGLLAVSRGASTGAEEVVIRENWGNDE